MYGVRKEDVIEGGGGGRQRAQDQRGEGEGAQLRLVPAPLPPARQHQDDRIECTTKDGVLRVVVPKDEVQK